MQRIAGVLAAEAARFVWTTNSISVEPPNIYETIASDLPVIVTFWHGHHLMIPFVRREYPVRVMISRHRDGEINAVAAERLGVGTVRGSGDHGNAFHRKGGVAAFKGLLRSLDEKINVALTADVPKVAQKAGLGIIMLARESGRPIMPVAVATSRFKRLKNWDRTVIHLPFGRGIVMVGDLISVPTDADPDAMENLRAHLEQRLNELTASAYAKVGRSDEGLNG